MRLSRLTLLVFALLSTLHQPARASNEGKMCDGLGILVCVPLFMVVLPVAAAVEAIKPKSPQDQLWRAFHEEDFGKMKRLLERNGELGKSSAAKDMLVHAAHNYLRAPNEELNGRALTMVAYLLDNGVDVTGERGSALLQATVPDSAPTPGEWAKRMALARLAFAHGASAQGVRVNYCLSCTQDEAFLPLMIEHGADINRGDATTGALFDRLVLRNNFSEAERLVRFGADPNGASLDGDTVLARIAEHCSVKEKVNSTADWLHCTAQSARQAEFVIAQGADPNGKPGTETGCVSPHAIASERKNQMLADVLIARGANPELVAQCKRALSPEALARFEQARANRYNCGCSNQARKPAAASAQP